MMRISNVRYHIRLFAILLTESNEVDVERITQLANVGVIAKRMKVRRFACFVRSNQKRAPPFKDGLFDVRITLQLVQRHKYVELRFDRPVGWNTFLSRV